MSKIIDKLFCCHEWETIKEAEFYEDGYDSPSYTTLLLCCKKCGKLKKVRL